MAGSKKQKAEPGEILSELVLKDEATAAGSAADLLFEPQQAPAADSFARELEKSLNETEDDARKALREDTDHQFESWIKARKLVEKFQPVPWFIWRLTNFVMGRPGETRQLTEGLVLGLRRLIFAAASDPFFGDSGKINNVRRALQVLRPDVIVAVSVIHAVCRRLSRCPHDRIWRPILDDAILRAQIGYFVGERDTKFGPGRGMLAGFAGRCGLAILIAGGNLEQARRALEMLATGTDLARVGFALYGSDPLQISAMTLSASGCGRDAAAGTVSYAVSKQHGLADNPVMLQWLSAFTVVELIRIGKEREIDNKFWTTLEYNLGQDRGMLIDTAKSMIRRGHSLPWIL